MEEETWDDWEVQEDERMVEFECLFCNDSFSSLNALWSHCISIHQFDVEARLRTLEFYARIQLINFLRHCKATGEAMDSIEEQLNQEAYIDPVYFQPVVSEDPVLYSLEDVLDLDGTSSDSDSDVDDVETGGNNS